MTAHDDPGFTKPLHVGRPNIGDTTKLMTRIQQMLDRRWFSNNGPLVQEFEEKLAAYIGVKHCLAVCNATVGLEIAARALGLRGEVIVPAYTFVATAHALRWQEITPVFADMNPSTHNIDPGCIEHLITSNTTGIVATHVWGRPCDVESIQAVADRHGLKVMYDAAHAFACSHNNVMIGNFGECEVFSFHATKFLNSFEGGAIATNNDALADKIRLMRNFGFAGLDNSVEIGTNGKMSEIHAAMGLTSLEAIDEIIAINKRNYEEYRDRLKHIPGIKLIEYSHQERNNYQYVVAEVEGDERRLSRDALIEQLNERKVFARKYFWPGLHRMPFYGNDLPQIANMRHTDSVAAKVIVLPTGQSADSYAIKRICALIAETLG